MGVVHMKRGYMIAVVGMLLSGSTVCTIDIDLQVWFPRIGYILLPCVAGVVNGRADGMADYKKARDMSWSKLARETVAVGALTTGASVAQDYSTRVQLQEFTKSVTITAYDDDILKRYIAEGIAAGWCFPNKLTSVASIESGKKVAWIMPPSWHEKIFGSQEAAKSYLEGKSIVANQVLDSMKKRSWTHCLTQFPVYAASYFIAYHYYKPDNSYDPASQIKELKRYFARMQESVPAPLIKEIEGELARMQESINTTKTMAINK